MDKQVERGGEREREQFIVVLPQFGSSLLPLALPRIFSL